MEVPCVDYWFVDVQLPRVRVGLGIQYDVAFGGMQVLSTISVRLDLVRENSKAVFGIRISVYCVYSGNQQPSDRRARAGRM